jgi:glycogen operon protein
MLLAGDEMGRSQRGNNNAYCQDSDISWIDWDLLQENAGLSRFFKLAIQFRKQHASLRRRYFFEDDPTGKILINWYGRRLNKPNWSAKSHYLAFHLLANKLDSCHIFVISNACPRKQNFQLPLLEDGKLWRRAADTSFDPPQDIAAQGEELILTEQNSYDTQPYSTVVLIA